jgi:hypothetical protein
MADNLLWWFFKSGATVGNYTSMFWSVRIKCKISPLHMLLLLRIKCACGIRNLDTSHSKDEATEVKWLGQGHKEVVWEQRMTWGKLPTLSSTTDWGSDWSRPNAYLWVVPYTLSWPAGRVVNTLDLQSEKGLQCTGSIPAWGHTKLWLQRGSVGWD